ncbi:MAG: hypothetical protein ACI4CS_01880 [Candidatus Weimeria sp.]
MVNSDVVYRIKDYLKKAGVADIDGEVTKMDKRAAGKKFTFSEHLQAVIYSLLSAQTVWANVERNLHNIDDLFFYYVPDVILTHDYSYYVSGLHRLGCGSRLTNNQMKALPEIITTMKRIENDYGSMDNFVTSKPAKDIVRMISSSGSKYKIKQFGPALSWEYLRNIGVDGAKPDVHMKRILGRNRLGVSKSEDASDDEVIDTIASLSKQTGLWMAQIDYLFWAYCATDKGEVCTANPACSRCVIREYCKYAGENG